MNKNLIVPAGAAIGVFLLGGIAGIIINKANENKYKENDNEKIQEIDEVKEVEDDNKLKDNFIYENNEKNKDK